jgi:hypothetical protein
MGGKGNYPKILGNENIRVKNDITKKDNTNGTFFFLLQWSSLFSLKKDIYMSNSTRRSSFPQVSLPI